VGGWSGVEWSGVEWSGVKRVEWSGESGVELNAQLYNKKFKKRK
jgi:hypothetical protein